MLLNITICIFVFALYLYLHFSQSYHPQVTIKNNVGLRYKVLTVIADMPVESQQIFVLFYCQKVYVVLCTFSVPGSLTQCVQFGLLSV